MSKLAQEQKFQGFTEDTYHFLLELAFNNNKEFFEQNRARYKAQVQQPLKDLAEDLLPDMLRLDPAINPRMTSIVSRIYRDTRFSYNKLPYRDHAWLGFRRPGHSISESISFYFEITPQSYGYGMGMYGPDTPFMESFRKRVLADPAGFAALVNAPGVDRFSLEGEPYKRDHFPDAPAGLKPYLNRKSVCWCFSSPSLRKTTSPELYGEVRDALARLGGLYRFLKD